MESRFTWNEIKRAKNLDKHQLDFNDVEMVLDNPYRLDVPSVRNGEVREQSFAFVFERLAVLTVVYLPGAQPHIISFRPASRVEREIYHDWLDMNSMDIKVVLAAVKNPPTGGDFVWDGVDEDDRPATEQEMRAAIEEYKKRGRPAGSGTKEQVAIRFDRDILAAFRTAGPGWQTRMNDALREWLHSHTPETPRP